MGKNSWTKREWFDDAEQVSAQCFFGVGNPKVLDNGVVRFDLTIYTDIGDLVLKGFRFDAKETRLIPPLYRAGKGWQQQVRLQGPVEEMVLEMAQEMVEAEPVEAEVVEARD